MVFSSKSILAVGAHPDDIELGCGGTISAASAAGNRVAAVFMTKGERSGEPGIRAEESKKALASLGVDQVFFGEFPDTDIPGSHEAVAFLETYFEKFNPEIVLVHSVNDAHQDHRQVGWLSVSAFRNAPRLLAYETPRVTPNFHPAYFVDISDHVENKWNALKCHLSQKDKRYLAYASMVQLASFRGSQVNLNAAESFEVVRYVQKSWNLR